MVKDHSIENSKVAEYLEDVDIIISHNAQFDRAFFETAFPDIVPLRLGLAQCVILTGAMKILVVLSLNI